MATFILYLLFSPWFVRPFQVICPEVVKSPIHGPVLDAAVSTDSAVVFPTPALLDSRIPHSSPPQNKGATPLWEGQPRYTARKAKEAP